ncbi:uncharacterized protein LOC128549011 [Mercenaria mercenaria]|uniref:uncharacterized protein LOC128549011 n=1 Tax=Mercenaria mercenaria TaxID=6596 RepID=UPI00234E89DF|nr:uncharacterized protein LOC128549011 [Mercenaria mercenaria]
MTCVNGKTLPNGQKSFEYTCGESTNHTWLPIDKTPECVDVSRPDIFGTQTIVTYANPISGSDHPGVTTAVEQQFSEVGCVKSGLCEVTSTVSDLSRKRRSTSSTLIMQFSIRLTDTGDLALGDYLSNGTETSAMTELLIALNAITEVIEFIQNNTASIFQVTVDGVDYTLASDTASIVATVTCPSGYAGADGLCAKCAVGTKLEDTICVDCEPGTYQPLTGQSTCLTCPTGYTTPTYGASDVSECSVEKAVTDNDSDDNDADDNDNDGADNTDDSEPTNNTVLIVVAVVSSVAFVLSVVAVSILLWKKCIRRRFRRNETNGSFASLSMVRSATSCSGVIENSRTTFNIEKIKGSIPATPQHHHNPMFEGAFQDKPPSYDSHGFS